MAADDNFLTEKQIVSVQNAIIRIGCEFLFFGIHAILYIISTYLLFYKGIRVVKARMLLLLLTSVMFLASLGVVIIDMIMVLRQAQTYGLNAPSTRELNLELRLASNVLMRFNFLLGDVIVVWRTWVVWPHNIKIKLLLTFCMLGTIGAIIGNGTKAALDLVRQTPESATYSLVMTLPPLITNLTATLLIALKVWEYRRNIKSSISSAKSTTRIEQMLMLLVESGLIYTAVWLLILIAGFDVMTSANNILILGIAVSLTGIYPTFIVIMVSLEKSHANTFFSGDSRTMTISQPLRFSHHSKPHAVHRQSSRQHSVTSDFDLEHGSNDDSEIARMEKGTRSTGMDTSVFGTPKRKGTQDSYETATTSPEIEEIASTSRGLDSFEEV
ncbi:hypothetical protein D9758_011842 [Tetrapyrgos nigripes]|uniref:Uncharacterized protein n=1 Tax=Tetrapyrgos nigripes TaxID=182062 RepID=A0A8H5CKL7_9AGAR|nr:hypothetical protein D9758_011842 [Tetrapyrgos nigripes]